MVLSLLQHWLQVARDLGTLWTTLQPPSDCSPSEKEALLVEVATASAAAHAAWQAEEDAKSQVITFSKLKCRLRGSTLPAQKV